MCLYWTLVLYKKIGSSKTCIYSLISFYLHIRLQHIHRRYFGDINDADCQVFPLDDVVRLASTTEGGEQNMLVLDNSLKQSLQAFENISVTGFPAQSHLSCVYYCFSAVVRLQLQFSMIAQISCKKFQNLSSFLNISKFNFTFQKISNLFSTESVKTFEKRFIFTLFRSSIKFW